MCWGHDKTHVKRMIRAMDIFCTQVLFYDVVVTAGGRLSTCTWFEHRGKNNGCIVFCWNRWPCFPITWHYIQWWLNYALHSMYTHLGRFWHVRTVYPNSRHEFDFSHHSKSMATKVLFLSCHIFCTASNSPARTQFFKSIARKRGRRFCKDE